MASLKNGQGKRTDEDQLKEDALKVFEDYTARKEEVAGWQWTEDSVKVYTKKYSYITLGVAIAIIGGSLSVPFTVGEGIAGVDPFDFVTFSWLLAGAFLVGVKSLYIEDWPWHDFLHGHVVCRSLSELADASKFDGQALLLCLLHHEFQKPLLFGGPYPGPFQQRSSSDREGFSIDHAVEYKTMLAAGFIVLEARTADMNPETNELKTFTLLHDTRDTKYKSRNDLMSGSVEHKRDKDKEIHIKLDQTLPRYNVVGFFTSRCKFI
jgi:hypothetical protein